jgi:drug/metabolite transporter (DMT)-like permease
MSLRKLITLGGVSLFAAIGDVCLSRGMKDVGAVTFGNLGALIHAVFNPWVALGILFLIAFFTSYLSALSFADLTYVLPATSVSYIVMALLARFYLHEQVSWIRWSGILLIALGVGFIARGPSLTVAPTPEGAIPYSEPTAQNRGEA